MIRKKVDRLIPDKPDTSTVRHERCVLRLYITGTTARSMQAVENVRRLCDRYLYENYDLQVIDIYRQPEQAREQMIIALPTLIRISPLPVRRIIGDMSRIDTLVERLNVERD